MRLIVWGAGELGTRVLARWTASGLEGIGYTRTDRRHEQIRSLNAAARKGSPSKQLRGDDALLCAIAGSAAQYEAIASLREVAPPPLVAVFISSVGYYDHPYGATDEATALGTTPHAVRIAKAETAFQEWMGGNGIILRLGGLYRPGRGPMSALIRRGSSPSGPPDRTLALIHYEDAAEAVFNALSQPPPQRIYLGVTPPCPTREAFYLAACKKAGLAPPIFNSPLAKPLTDYNVSRLRRDLLPKPLYADWHYALE